MNFRFAEVALKVSDLTASIAFYTEMFGFEQAHAEGTAVFLKIGELESPLGRAGHAQLLALFKRDVALDATRSTLDHLALEVSPGEYERLLARFKAKEMVIRERAWPDTLFWPARSFFFRDPDNNVIEIIAANQM